MNTHRIQDKLYFLWPRQFHKEFNLAKFVIVLFSVLCMLPPSSKARDNDQAEGFRLSERSREVQERFEFSPPSESCLLLDGIDDGSAVFRDLSMRSTEISRRVDGTGISRAPNGDWYSNTRLTWGFKGLNGGDFSIGIKATISGGNCLGTYKNFLDGLHSSHPRLAEYQSADETTIGELCGNFIYVSVAPIVYYQFHNITLAIEWSESMPIDDAWDIIRRIDEGLNAQIRYQSLNESPYAPQVHVEADEYLLQQDDETNWRYEIHDPVSGRTFNDASLFIGDEIQNPRSRGYTWWREGMPLPRELPIYTFEDIYIRHSETPAFLPSLPDDPLRFVAPEQPGEYPMGFTVANLRGIALSFPGIIIRVIDEDGTLPVVRGGFYGWACDNDEWHFVITKVDDCGDSLDRDNASAQNGRSGQTLVDAPDHITVHFRKQSANSFIDDETVEVDIPLERVDNHAAHYRTSQHLDLQLHSIAFEIDGHWQGEAQVESGPCIDEDHGEDHDRGHGNDDGHNDEDNPGRGHGDQSDDGDHDRGHGNNDDRHDEDNPGRGQGNRGDDGDRNRGHGN
ncbi:MAG: hypothetical protein NUW37_03790 [Planctomycetes bacterium]|nr:hypothetical protein [Planctomycetota bacterium]